MIFYDITREVRTAPLYPGTPEPQLLFTERIGQGSEYNLSRLFLDSHTGTHCDAPLHFLADGRDISQLSPEYFVGDCSVLTVSPASLIRPEDLAGRISPGIRRLLLHTGGNSYLTEGAASYLVSLGLLAVGTDAMSVAPPENEAPVHQILLAAPIVVLEQLELAAVPDGVYFLSALPLKVAGAEAAPCRAVLIRF